MQKRIFVTKRNVYFGVRGDAPDDQNFFVLVSFVFLAKPYGAAGIDESCVHHQRSLVVHHVFPHCVRLYQKVDQETLRMKEIMYR